MKKAQQIQEHLRKNPRMTIEAMLETFKVSNNYIYQLLYKKRLTRTPTKPYLYGAPEETVQQQVLPQAPSQEVSQPPQTVPKAPSEEFNYNKFYLMTCTFNKKKNRDELGERTCDTLEDLNTMIKNLPENVHHYATYVKVTEERKPWQSM